MRYCTNKQPHYFQSYQRSKLAASTSKGLAWRAALAAAARRVLAEQAPIPPNSVLWPDFEGWQFGNPCAFGVLRYLISKISSFSFRICIKKQYSCTLKHAKASLLLVVLWHILAIRRKVLKLIVHSIRHFSNFRFNRLSNSSLKRENKNKLLYHVCKKT